MWGPGVRECFAGILSCLPAGQRRKQNEKQEWKQLSSAKSEAEKKGSEVVILVSSGISKIKDECSDNIFIR